MPQACRGDFCLLKPCQQLSPYSSGEPNNIKCLPRKIKNVATKHVATFRKIFEVVPPGIVIYAQAALYHHFSESPQQQSPPIAPPLDFCVLRVVECG